MHPHFKPAVNACQTTKARNQFSPRLLHFVNTAF
jgi:hypothetical protein